MQFGETVLRVIDVKLVVGATTDVGQVRDGNEDRSSSTTELRLFAVADGMGGHHGGRGREHDRARGAARRGRERARRSTRRSSTPTAPCTSKAATDTALAGMGTTLTAIAVGSERAVVVGHVGDSRAYLVRDGKLEQITTDHSLVEEMVREGRITEDQALVHPQRSIITRALGIDAEVEVDLYPVELQPDDRLLICSDGLTDMVRPAEIARILRREPRPAARVGRARRRCERRTAARTTSPRWSSPRSPTTPSPSPARPSSTTAVVPRRPPVTDTAPRQLDSARRDRRSVRSHAAADAPRRGAAAQSQASARPCDARAGPSGSLVARAGPADRRRSRSARCGGTHAAATTSASTVRPVTVYHGVPGGLLGWDPTVERRTDPARVRPAPQDQVQDLRDGHPFSSQARRRALRRSGSSVQTTTTSTTTTTTTTTTAAHHGAPARRPRRPAP